MIADLLEAVGIVAILAIFAVGAAALFLGSLKSGDLP